MGNQELGSDVPGSGKSKRRAATTKAAQTFTLLPPIGFPDHKMAVKLFAPVILSIWEKHRGRGDFAKRIDES